MYVRKCIKHNNVQKHQHKCIAKQEEQQVSLTGSMAYDSFAAYSRQREKRNITWDTVFSEASGPCRPWRSVSDKP
jgi:hypothetical protein